MDVISIGWSRSLAATLIGVAGVVAMTMGYAQADSDEGSIGGSIAPLISRQVIHPKRKLPAAVHHALSQPPQRQDAHALSPPTCQLKMLNARNPDGSACSIVVGFSGGSRVGAFHNDAGTNAGTCEGFLHVTYLSGNVIGYNEHMRTLSDDCKTSTGY